MIAEKHIEMVLSVPIESCGYEFTLKRRNFHGHMLTGISLSNNNNLIATVLLWVFRNGRPMVLIQLFCCQRGSSIHNFLN